MKVLSAPLLASVVGVGLLMTNAVGAQGVSPTSSAVAQAEQRFTDGVLATEHGDFATGLRAFQESYELNPLPDVLYNIGMCHKALGDPVAAANAFRGYTVAVGGNLSPEERAEFDELLSELAPQIGRVVFGQVPDGATVRVDGVEVDPPAVGADWLAVEPGAHRVEANDGTSAEFNSEFRVAAGQMITVDIQLRARTTGDLGHEPATDQPTGADGEGQDGALSPWFWTCVGLAGASALTMAITGGLTLKYNDDFDTGGRTDAGLRDTTLALRTTTDVFLGIGLAAVVAGIVILLVPQDEETPSDSGHTVALLPAGLVLRW